jgi:hypothetical protein
LLDRLARDGLACRSATSVEVYAPGPSQEGRGFQKGHPRYGGRQKGSRNKFGGDLREAVVP